MRDVGPELGDHRPDPPPCVPRIDGMTRAARLLPETTLTFEFNVRDEMSIVRSRLAPRVGHGEQGHVVTLRAQQVHQFEEVNLGAAERIVIFVAEENSHYECSQGAGRSAVEISRRMTSDFSSGRSCGEPAL